MRRLVGEIFSVFIFALCMTGAFGLPIFLIFNIHDLLLARPSEQLTVFCLCGFAFFVCIGMLGMLKHRKRLQHRALQQGTSEEQSEETQLIQEVYRRAGKMEKRLESLETILLERVEVREGIRK